MNQAEDRKKALERADQWVAADALILDTETLGLNAVAQICDVAIMDMRGTVLLSALVKPLRPISPVITKITHITDEMVTCAPTFADLAPALHAILDNRLVLTYNAEFDWNAFVQSARAHNLEWSHAPHGNPWSCAMKTYAAFRGEINPHYGSYRWAKLGEAATSLKLPMTEELHRAQADTDLARRVVLALADIYKQETWTPQPT